MEQMNAPHDKVANPDSTTQTPAFDSIPAAAPSAPGRWMHPKFLRFLSWFRQPSNILSVAAIIAALIVPWMEKLAKSDEDLRNQIDVLLTSTKNITSMGRSRQFDPTSDSILSAQRENELERANAIAQSIKHKVYPSVLLALSNELCSSGEFKEAHDYLDEVIRRGHGLRFFSSRPPAEEVSGAYALSAKCYVQEAQRSGPIDQKSKELAETAMKQSIELLGSPSTDRDFGDRALSYAQWVEIDERLGDSTLAEEHKEKARESAKKMTYADPTITAALSQFEASQPAISAPAIQLKEENLPRTATEFTYLVTYPDQPNIESAFILPRFDTEGINPSGAEVFFYNRGLFYSALILSAYASPDRGKHLTRIYFQREMPSAMASPPTTTRSDAVWVIEKMDSEQILGTETQLNQPPRRFVAHRSHPNEELAAK